MQVSESRKESENKSTGSRTERAFDAVSSLGETTLRVGTEEKPVCTSIILNQRALDNNLLPHEIIRPGYDRSKLTPSCVVLGGTSRLAGGLMYPLLDKAAANYCEEHPNCDQIPFGVIAVGFSPQRAPNDGRDTLNTLAASDGLYTVEERGLDSSREPRVCRTVVGCIQELLRAGPDTHAIINHIASPHIATVMMSITAKNYFLNGQNRLRLDHSEVEADTRNPQAPKTAIGILVEGIRQRMIRNPESFLTVFCAENLPPPSGPNVHGVLMEYCEAAHANDKSLMEYLESHVFIPSVSVDRLCPDDSKLYKGWREEMKSETGVVDSRIIRTESPDHGEVMIDIGSDPKAQNRARAYFLATNPFIPLDGNGHVIVTEEDGRNYATVKQAIINATHVELALIGAFYLGVDTPVHEVLNHRDLGSMIREFLNSETCRSLRGVVPKTVDLTVYVEKSLARLGNPLLPDPVSRITSGGFGRLGRVLSIEERCYPFDKEDGYSPDSRRGPALTIALWTTLNTLELRRGREAYVLTDNREIYLKVQEAKEHCSQLLKEDATAGVSAVFTKLADSGVFGQVGLSKYFQDKVVREIERLVNLATTLDSSSDTMH